MSPIATRFVAQIRRNIESWRAHEIDHPAFMTQQRNLWAAVRSAGPGVEAEVVRTLMNDALSPDLAARDERPTLSVKTARRSAAAPRQPYRGLLTRTETGSPVLRIAADDPHGPCAAHRKISAVVYELAAELEHKSHELEAHWTIVTDAENAQLTVELAGQHEDELARELIANLMNSKRFDLRIGP